MTDKFFDEIIEERGRQDKKYGGPEDDDDLSIAEWRIIIRRHVAKAGPGRGKKYRAQLVRIAALCKAAGEAYDRKADKKNGDD